MTTWKDEDDAPPLTGDELIHLQGQWKHSGEPVDEVRGKAAFREALKNCAVPHERYPGDHRPKFRCIVVTAYRPSPDQWHLDNKTRKP